MRREDGRTIAAGASTLLLLLCITPSAHAQRFFSDGTASPPAPAPSRAIVELSLREWVLAASDYAVAQADTALAAGAGVGAAIETRYLGLRDWTLAVQVMTLRRSSHDARLSETRVWHVSAGIDRRLRLLDPLELRLGVRLGYHWLSFDDADAVTTGFGASVAASFHVRVMHGFWLELAGGALAQPFAGNSLTDITFAPTAFAAAGFCAQVFD